MKYSTKYLREKYGDHPRNPSYTFPDHFFAPNDVFTTFIELWKEALKYYVDKPNLNFLEIGTGGCRSGIWTLENILTGDNCKLTTVDISATRKWSKDQKVESVVFDEDTEYDIRENLKPYIEENKCEFVESDSKKFLKTFNVEENKILDFIYIDGWHEPDYVVTDACLAWPSLKSGGILIFDDYGWGNCKFGIDGFLISHQLQLDVVYKDWQVVIQKK